MRSKLLYIVIATVLSGCATPTAITELPKATSIDNYCTGAAGFALKMAKRRDQGDDLDYTKQEVLADSVSLTTPSQARERVKMLDVLSYVYQNPSRTPQELREDIYQTCMEERADGTWFHN